MTNPADAADGAVCLDNIRVELEIEFPSDVRYIERVVDLITRQCEELRFSPRQCSLNVRVALAEALSNAILRGNEVDPAKSVHVRAEVSTDKMVVEVADEGRHFDLERSMRDPTLPDNLDREDGRGLYLMRQLMDQVERYDRVGKRDGNVVRMTLRRE